MSRREARLVELALRILHAESKRHGEVARSDGVRLALRVLLRHVDRHTLISFWTVASNDNPSQRTHNLRRVLRTIDALVTRAVGLPRTPDL